MPGSFYGNRKSKIYAGVKKIKKVYAGKKLVYSIGNTVTYTENGIAHVEDVEEGMTVLSPSSFSPSKPGWTFIGWSTSVNSTHVQTSLVMGESPIALYAVWSKDSNVPDQNLSFSYNGPADGLNYNPGGNWTASASIDDAKINNGTTGMVYLTISVSGGCSRSWESKATQSGTDSAGNPIYTYNQTETSGSGYGGKTVSINGSGNIIGNANLIHGYGFSGGNVHVSNVVKKGYSYTEYSVG